MCFLFGCTDGSPRRVQFQGRNYRYYIYTKSFYITYYISPPPSFRIKYYNQGREFHGFTYFVGKHHIKKNGFSR